MSYSTTNCSSSTIVETQTLSHRWVIEGFRSYCDAAGYASEKTIGNRSEYKSIESVRFRNEHFEMFLECYPYLSYSSVCDNGPDHLAVNLCLVSSKLENTPFNFTISIIDRHGNERIKQKGNKKQLQNNIFCEWDHLSNCRDDNKLSIYCEVKYITTSTNPPIENNAPESNHFEKMAINFAKLRKESDFSDITLVVRAKEFRAHKFLLCAQSPVFKAMFLKLDTKEKQNGRVQITDVDSNVFEKLLDFIYSGKSECVKGFEDQLLAAADKYGLENLKEACEDALYVKLTPASVPDLLVLADAYNASKLKQKALDYLQIHEQDTIQAMLANNQADQLISAFRNMVIPGGSNQSSTRGGTGQGTKNRNIKPILKQGGNNLINFNN